MENVMEKRGKKFQCFIVFHLLAPKSNVDLTNMFAQCATLRCTLYNVHVLFAIAKCVFACNGKSAASFST